MKPVDIYLVARTGALIEGRVSQAALLRLQLSLNRSPPRDAVPGAPTIVASRQLRYRCQGSQDAQGRPALDLYIEAELPLVCDLCDRSLRFALSAQRHFYFVATQEALAAVPIDDSPEEALIGSTQFDLMGLIEDEAILQLPLSPRHTLCTAAPWAQASLAVKSAPDAEPPHPFAALASLLRGPS